MIQSWLMQFREPNGRIDERRQLDWRYSPGQLISRFSKAITGSIDTPVRVALAALVLSAIYLAARLLVAGKHDLGTFIVAGSSYVDSSKLPSRIPIISGSGYDGQFYYRLALDPFSLATTHAGITLDTVFREQRIAYPFLSWVVSLGMPRFVPAALVLVNLIAIALVAYFASALAVLARKPAIAGLIIAAFPGYLFSIGRDLAEPTAAAFLLGSILAIRKRHGILAALALTASVLTKETALLVVGSIAIVWVANLFKDESQRLESPPWYLWSAPLAAFVLWQVVVRNSAGHNALKSDVAGNLSIPFRAMAYGLLTHMEHPFETANLVWLLQLVALAIVVATALTKLRSRSIPLFVRISLVAMALLSVSLSSEIWSNNSNFRSLDLAWLLGWLALIFDTGGLPKWWPAAIIPTLFTGALLVVFV